jgi:hypothetical protein
VIEGLLPLFRRLDEDRKLAADLFLADVLFEGARAQRALEHFFLRAHRRGGDQTIGLDHASIMPAASWAARVVERIVRPWPAASGLA